MKGLSGSFPTNPYNKSPYWISAGIGAAYVMRLSLSLFCYNLKTSSKKGHNLSKGFNLFLNLIKANDDFSKASINLSPTRLPISQ